MFITCEKRKAGYSKSLEGWQVLWICVCQRVQARENFIPYQCRSLALKQIKHPQKNASDILVHVPSSANAHLKDEYELLTVISIKKKATQTYPTSRQNTISAFVQGIPVLSWTMK